MQDFADLAHGRHVPVFAQAKANAAPAVIAGWLGRQVSRQQAATLVDLQQQFKGAQRLGHGAAVSLPAQRSGS
ncbi:hypothetical protein D3C76_1591180 [compost metagenome]